MIYKQKALFCTYVFTRTPNPLEFRRRRSLDDVQASLRLRRTLASENFTSGSRRPAISSSMLKFPNVVHKPSSNGLLFCGNSFVYGWAQVQPGSSFWF